MAFRAWQRLKQRFELGLETRQGIVMAEFSGMVARLAMRWRNFCMDDRDGPQDEVGGGRDRGGSQRDARAVSILHLVTLQHAAAGVQSDDGPGSNADWTI